MKEKILLLFILILIVFGLSSFKSGLNISSFQNKEKVTTNYRIETPNISDKNLAAFYLWTLEDPLLTAPGFDIEEYKNAVMMLKNENDIYIEEYNMPGNIYPINFLQDLVNVNNAHVVFIDNPTLENAQKLIKSYRIAIADYKKDILELKKSTKKIIPSSLGKSLDKVYLVEINSVSSLQTYFDDLDKLILNADVLYKEILKREGCLKEGIACVRPADKFYDFSLNEDPTSFKKTDLVPRDLLWTPLATMSAFTSYGPYVVYTECFGWSDDLDKKPLLFDIYKAKKVYPFLQNPINFTQFYAQFANDRVYHFEQDFIYKEAKSPKRIQVVPSNDYMCPSAEYKSKLNSIDSLYALYKNKQFSSTFLKLKGLSNEARQLLLIGQKLENKFYNSEFPSETDADNLVNYYGLLYKKIVVWEDEIDGQNNLWLDNMFEKRIEILTLYLKYKRGLVRIDEMISNLMYNLYAFRKQNEYFNVRSRTPDIYVYIARGGYGLVYFPFSESFYRYDRKPDYVLKVKYDNVGKNKKFIYYKQLLKDYSSEEIKSWYNLFYPNYVEYLNKNSLLNM